ncbi:MAG TPA: hypothetical protein VEI04_06820 [Syntrophobacteria bacterium]|nr:hypothetical protein [Syntrophobacteria bacterium]
MQSLRRQWRPVLLWALTGLGIVMGSQAFSQGGEPTLAIPSPTYDAGVVWEGETLSHSFEVRNEGKGELRILEVRPG